MMRRNHVIVLLLGILLVGFLVRLQAVRWNWFMHGDVIDDVSVAAGIHRDGRLLAYDGPLTADPAAYPLPPLSQGEALKQHGPLWPIFGAMITRAWGGGSTMSDAFLSLRLLSLLTGMLVIILSYFVARRLIDTDAGLAISSWTAVSYVLIDYAGNGSFYSFQAAVYLLWLLIAFAPFSSQRTVLLGVVAGIGYLANFQSIILLPAGFLLLFWHRECSWSRLFLHWMILLLVALAIASPWLIRNAILFGDPLYSHAWNMRYVLGKAGFALPADGVLHLEFSDKLSVLAGVFHTWLPNNLYYAARKLFVLAPFAFFLFSFGLLDVLFSRPRLHKTFPLLLLLVFHILLSAAWPIWKFRYFVPLLPLVFLMALEELWHLPLTPFWRKACIGTTFAAMVFFSILTYRATPTHTTYYDGAITQDAFHGSEEESYLRTYHLLFLPNGTP